MPLTAQPGLIKIPRTPTEKCLPGGRTLITLRPNFTSLDANNNTLPFTFNLNALGPHAMDDVRGIYIENNHLDANGQIGTLVITVQDTGQQISVAQGSVVALPLWMTGSGSLLITATAKNAGLSAGAPFIELLNFEVMPFYIIPPVSSGGSGAPIPFHSQGATSGSGFNSDQQGANGIDTLYLDVFDAVDFNQICINVTGADNGVTLSDFGIYDTSGNRLCHVGAQTGIGLVGSGANFFSIVEGEITLQPGRYIFAFTASANAGGFFYSAGVTNCIAEFYSTASISAAGNLPANIIVTKVLKDSGAGLPGNINFPVVLLRKI